MNQLLKHLGVWKALKSEIFTLEGYEVSISAEFGDSKKTRYMDIDTTKLVARATLWESGELELEATEVKSGKNVTQKSVVTPELTQLDAALNWWLSEIATH